MAYALILPKCVSMSFNLIETVKSALSGDMTNKMAGMLGESSANIQQAMQGIVPAILTGVLLKADAGDTQDTLNLATEAARIDIPFNLNSLAGGQGNSRGMDFLKNLFGEKTAGLSDSIAGYAGVSNQSASSLMSIAAPTVLGILGKHILDSNMNASGLRSFLNSQRKKILNALPTGIFLEGIMGFENLSGIAGKFMYSENPPEKKRSGTKWVVPLVLLLIAIVAVWFFMNKPATPGIPQQPVTDTVVAAKDTSSAGPVSDVPNSLKLPDGTILNVKKGGIEDQLILFFNDPNAKPSRRFQFNFDQVGFNEGTSVITNESMVQIQNVANILKAYPKAKIKIGGFNERGGDSVSNQTLSENRATSIAAAIKSEGANPKQIIGVEGFGSDFAKYPAGAPDSLRDKDRRISISIRNK
jgi:outer membrane protein OmpA-like peptidoglycan-associated protein